MNERDHATDSAQRKSSSASERVAPSAPTTVAPAHRSRIGPNERSMLEEREAAHSRSGEPRRCARSAGDQKSGVSKASGKMLSGSAHAFGWRASARSASASAFVWPRWAKTGGTARLVRSRAYGTRNSSEPAGIGCSATRPWPEVGEWLIARCGWSAAPCAVAQETRRSRADCGIRWMVCAANSGLEELGKERCASAIEAEALPQSR